MDQGIRTCEAMELRGYKGYMPFGALPRISSERSLDFVPDLGSDSDCIHLAGVGCFMKEGPYGR